MFATAKCGHCGKTGTKIEMIESQGAAYKQSAVCCRYCNAILGVTGYYDVGHLVKQQEGEIKALKSQLDQIGQMVQQIGQSLSRR